MKERVKFVLEWEKRWNEGEGVLDFAERRDRRSFERCSERYPKLAELLAQSTTAKCRRCALHVHLVRFAANRAWYAEARMRWAVLGACVALGAACGPQEWRPPQEADSHEDPAKLRPGYGNDQLHVWWPLTSAETAAVAGIERARQGDAHALLALAILGSGDMRDDASYARYTRRFDQFIEDQRASIEASSDDAKRGELLEHAMHKAFFTGTANKDDPKVGAYELNQARLTQVFEQGHYNCISSALLYTTLARAYSLPVRGAITETHAFVEFGPSAGAHVDVETTTDAGFGEVHDEKFFRDWAQGWSSARGLKPLTMAEYQKREIVPPYVLVARAMMDDRIWGKDDGTKSRLSEIGGLLAPEDAYVVHNRLATYANEANWLFEHKAFRTILRMVEVVSPFVSDVPDRFPKNEKLLADVAWIAWHDAKALSVVSRGDEAVAIASDVYDRVQPSWPEADKLKHNLLWVMADRMTELQVKGEHEKSLAVMEQHVAACHDDSVCLNNLYLTFDEWCVRYQVAKDWPNAKKVMEKCIALLPDDTRCHHTLEGLTSLHP